ncbi:MAG: hypothetical protein K2G99_00205 [Desulfovibrio sp.]|nr:hypothetical protein [Desulfovibrio sp.]
MAKTLCILHANCQGDALRPLLENTPAFARLFEIRQRCNYTREEVAERDLAACGLFLHQRLAPRWGELATESLLPRLGAGCEAIILPNLFFKGYWPFWTNAFTGIDFADSLLEKLLGAGLAPDDAMRLYLKGDPALLGDVAAVAEDSLAREEAKEAQDPIRTAHILRERWREEQLFLTVNHPGRTLLFHVAEELLRLLGLGPLPESVKRAYVHPQEEFWLPLHPALGPRLGLSFASRERRYPVFGASLTHQEYTAAYLSCRAHGVRDLVGFLRGMGEDAAAASAASPALPAKGA